MLRVDLHVHSTCSDGTCTPAEIARIAHRSRIAVLALTDHDTVDGVRDFMRACEAYAVRPISGIELSAVAPVTTHILGYRFGCLEKIEQAMGWILDRRNRRNELICEKLRGLGLDVKLEDIEKEAGGRVIARPHFAGVLVKKGYVADYQEAFDRYLAKGAAAYVPREAFSPEQCIALIRKAGGLSVLAHPSQTGLDYDSLGDMLDDLKKFGLWGLECISSHCSSEQAYNYMKLAEKHNLYPTAGSDFHGSRRPGVTMGVQVSEDFLPWARLGVKM